MTRERMTTDRVVRAGSTGVSRGAVPQLVCCSQGSHGCPPPPQGFGVCWSSPWCFGWELWAVPGGRGQSRFSGTGWAGRSVGWRLLGRGGGGGKPQSDVSFTVPLGSPPDGVQLSLRAPGGACGVSTGELLPLPRWHPRSCCLCCLCAALPGCSPPPRLSAPASSRCFLGFGSGCAHNIFSPVPAAFCARVPRGGGCGGGRVKETSGREEEEVAEGSPEVSSCFWEHP